MPRSLLTIDQPAARQSQQDDQALDVSLRRLKVSDELPARCGVKHMCHAFGIDQSTFYRWLKRGDFNRFELKPTIGNRAWSGAKVKAFLDGRR